MARPHLLHETIGGKTYWFTAPIHTTVIQHPTIHLLPSYDEYLVAYKDHTPSFDPSLRQSLQPNTAALQAHIIVLNGHVIGGWRRTIQKKAVTITTDLLIQLGEAEQAALKSAAERYSRFMELPVTLL